MSGWMAPLTRRCASCGDPLPSPPLPACTRCEHIAPLSRDAVATYYDLFDLPRDEADANPFALVEDARARALLKGRFRRAQAVCHPDAWASKGTEKLRLAQALSSEINHGYNLLLSPYLRAEYILRLNGVEITEHDSLNDDFMMEVLETRSELEQAEPDQVSEMERANQEAIQGILAHISEMVGRKEWQRVKTGTMKLKFLLGIEAAIKARTQDYT